jgi:hypothetical protein
VAGIDRQALSLRTSILTSHFDFLRASTNVRRTNSLIGTPVALERASKAFFKAGSN